MNNTFSPQMEAEDSPADDSPPPTQGKERRGINDLHNTNQCQVYSSSPSSNPIISHGAYTANINRCYFINVNQVRIRERDTSGVVVKNSKGNAHNLR